jgi:hypothetical protein
VYTLLPHSHTYSGNAGYCAVYVLCMCHYTSQEAWIIPETIDPMGPSDLRCSCDYRNELALTLSLHVTTSYQATLLQMVLSSKLLLFHSTLLQTKLVLPAFIPLEIWSRVIQLCDTPGDSSWEDSHWPMPKMITALSLTCSRLYHECKRQMLACIWIEFGPSNMHWHTIS